MTDPAPYRAACNAHRSGLPGVLDGIRGVLQGRVLAAVQAKVLDLRHPGTPETMARPLVEPPGEPGSRLRGMEHLDSGRYGFPEQEFTATNSVLGEFGTEPWLSLRTGDAAVDFEPLDERGEPCRLHTLPQTRPVLLTFGWFTAGHTDAALAQLLG